MPLPWRGPLRASQPAAQRTCRRRARPKPTLFGRRWYQLHLSRDKRCRPMSH